MRRLAFLAAGGLVAVLLSAVGSSAAPMQETKLIGTVGPDFTISLTDAQGNRVAKLDPGAYEIEVRDRSDFHTFHLQGPAVDERTQVEFTGDVTWHVTLKDGVYTYLCDVHPSSMRGTFTVGTPTTSPPPAKPITAKTKLVLTSGPAMVITLKTAAGKTFKSMRLGIYTVTVRDRGRIHDAHIVAPGFNRKTTPLTFVGTQVWKMKLARTGTLRFFCDPHRLLGMKGSEKIVR